MKMNKESSVRELKDYFKNLNQKDENNLALYDKYVDSHLPKANRFNSAEHGVDRKPSLVHSNLYLMSRKTKDLTRNVKSEVPATKNNHKHLYSKNRIPNYVK